MSRRKLRLRRQTGILVLIWLMVRLATPIQARALEKGSLTWKPLDTVQLTVSGPGKPAKTWAIYQAVKKDRLLLVQIDQRWLFVDLKQRAVYELDGSKILHAGQRLQSGNPETAEGYGRPLKTSDWDSHDLGVATRIRLTLTEENRQIEIQIPHTPDLRGLY